MFLQHVVYALKISFNFPRYRLNDERFHQKIVDHYVSSKSYEGPPNVQTRANGRYFVSWIRAPSDLVLTVKR